MNEKTSIMTQIVSSVTEEIIDALKKGLRPWQPDWKTSPGGFLPIPFNLRTKRPYKGFNFLILSLMTAKHGYKTHGWLTAKQCIEIGGKIQKGSKGTKCFFSKPMVEDDSESDSGEKIRWTTRYFTLFNLDQLDNINFSEVKVSVEDTVSVEATVNDKFAIAKKIFDSSGANLSINPYGNCPLYNPARDEIVMLPIAQFKREEGYYSALLHELVHWTGHESRLNRPSGLKDYSVSKKNTAFEELIADIGSAYLCSYAAISGEIENHVSYIGSWLKMLESDPRKILDASRYASDASFYIIEKYENEAKGLGWTEKTEQKVA